MNIRTIALTQIFQDPEQPRKQLNEETLQGLADSIRQHGLLNPITVSQDKNSDRYIIVTGERRWRASGMAKLEAIPCVVSEIPKDERLTQQLIENLQREDLQPLEKAKAILAVKKALNQTNREVAKRLGVSERSVGYTLDLLDLPEEIGETVVSSPNRAAGGQITEKHARALKQLNPEPETQRAVAEKIRGDKLSSDDTGKLVKALRDRPEQKDAILKAPKDHLSEFFGDAPSAKKEEVLVPRISSHAQHILEFLSSLSGISLASLNLEEVRQMEDALSSLQMATTALLRGCKERLGGD